MKKKIVGLLICTVLIVTAFPIIDAKDENKTFENQISLEEIGGCAGAIATGSVVKDGRSIFWKNRHMSGEDNKPFFYQGASYKYYGIGQATGNCLMGINEKGLAVGNFAVDGPIENWEYISDGLYGPTSDIMNFLLGNYDNVYDAAMCAAYHMGGISQLGIISSETGVGAVVAVSNYDGTCRTNITWINNTYAALANAFYCDGDHDVDGNDITIDNMLNDITTNGGINGDFKIDWEEMCQRGGKNVSGKEEGSGYFNCSYEITKSNCVSGFVAVSGEPDYDGAANIGWLAMGRQPLVGIWLPLAASCLTTNEDIPSEYRDDGGIEDYVDRKVFYGTNGEGQGCSIYSCERVREILEVTNSNESFMFNEYDDLIADIPPDATPSQVKSIIKSFVDDMTPSVLSAYESYNHPPDEPFNPSPEDEEMEVFINTCLNWSSEDPDGDLVFYDVYFGEYDLYNDPPIVSNNQSSSLYCPDDVLDFDTDYAWKIVSWDEYGSNSSGDIWTFTTEENLPPSEPSNPDPANGATDVTIYKILSWTGGDPNPGDEVLYDVYFGTSSPPPLVAEDLTKAEYNPGTMELGITYFWQIVSEDSQGLTTNGPIWSFTTEEEPNESPTAPEIDGPLKGSAGTELCWTFQSNDPEGNDVKYNISWGDGNYEETVYYPVNTPVEVCHTYDEDGTYTITAIAEDIKGAKSDKSTFEVTIPRYRTYYNSLFFMLLERFPYLISKLGNLFRLLF
ncbi:MAG: PKD domain-containing protein [Thermoplasmatales archaeon]|nr:MAG: PKD domain-containing protein [Thermoplasmatales archaeon]